MNDTRSLKTQNGAFRRFDAHVHTAASPDSDMPPALAIETLARQGLGCIFTEHLDYNKSIDHFMFDADLYPETYHRFRSDTVRIGIELGMNPDFEAENRAWLARYPWDFVLGAVHWFDAEGGDTYAHKAEIYAQWGDAAYGRYLRFARDMVERYGDVIDAFAHIDYPRRVLPLPERDLDTFAEEYDALFRALAERDIRLEVNTRRLAEPGAADHWVDLLHRFRAAGGRRVTVGSDSHEPTHLGYMYKTALRMIEATDLQL